MVAQYHLLRSGRRQYLSFHMVGDMPDAQGLFIDQINHSLCALESAVIAFIPLGPHQAFQAEAAGQLCNMARDPDRRIDLPRGDCQQ
jgi:hypothetical protein